MFIFTKNIPLSLNADQSTIKNNLLHNTHFSTKEESNTIILSRYRHIPKIPFINKLIRLFVARVTTTVSVKNRSLHCKFSINREAAFGFIVILGGVVAHISGALVEEDIPPISVYILMAIYVFFLVYEIYTNYDLIRKITTV